MTLFYVGTALAGSGYGLIMVTMLSLMVVPPRKSERLRERLTFLGGWALVAGVVAMVVGLLFEALVSNIVP